MTAPTPEQCTALNDGMEGVRCHGDAGHQELHWADVSGDGDMTEWGDNDELWDEIDRLRAAADQLEAVHKYAEANYSASTVARQIVRMMKQASND